MEVVQIEDPNYVKSIVRLVGFNIEKTISYHKCTEEDLEGFYPTVIGQEKTSQIVESSGGYNCIDWNDEDPYLVYGEPYLGMAWQSLEVILAPCNYVGSSGQHTIPPGCNTDL